MPSTSARHRGEQLALVVLCELALVLTSTLSLAQERSPRETTPPPGDAPGGDDDVSARGRAAFVEGTTLARQGKWREALAAFERSSSLRAHPVTTYNIGFCERVLQHSTRARSFFARALADHEARSGGELPEDLEQAARTYLAEIEASLARPLVTLMPEGTAISIDGRPLEVLSIPGDRPTLVAGTREPGAAERPPAPRFFLVADPGPHTILLTRAGRPDLVTTRTFEASADLEVSLQANAEPAREAPQTRARGAIRPARSKTPGKVALGIGAAGVVAGGVTGVLFLVNRSALADACVGRECPTDRAGQIAATNALGTTAVIGLGVGALGLGVGALLWVRAADPAATTSSLRPWIGSGSAGVTGAF